ncbi:dihydrolipoyl dehydrogenase family protein [Nocardioides sp. GCM10027113]|uniref:dihydrolipoyl dehydrogenase family protein n=1 Tax=unclassified Nocardioides TaxID=2615069 RepID=UPI00361F2855
MSESTQPARDQQHDNGVPDSVDVVVVGMGVGGEAVAGQLLDAGLSVVGIEDGLVGGECPYWGCIPSKMMVRAADAIAETRRVGDLAGSATVDPDWSPVARRIREEATDHWDDQVAVDRFTGAGGHFVRGRGRLAGPGRVEVDGPEGGVTVTATRGVVVATGTVPAVPPVDGLADTPYWTNRQAVEAETLPASMLVLGGGAIGLELAQAFHRFGVDVTVLEAADRLLVAEEPEASELVTGVLRDEGITIETRAAASHVSHDDSGFTVTLEDGRTFTGERLLVATGRRVDVSGLGLDTVDLEADRALDTDERMRAGDGVWAVGDVTGRGAFTHVATYQAAVAVADILGRDGRTADYAAVPRVTFTDPEVGSVGLTEQQARDRGLDVRTGTAQVPSSARGWIHKAGNEGLVKLVVDGGSDLLVGATSAGPAGGEVLGALSVAVHGRVPVSHLRQMIYAYPTFHRAIEDALRDLGD